MVDALDGRVQIFGIATDGTVSLYSEVPGAHGGSLYICKMLAIKYGVQLDAWGVYRAQELGKLFGTSRVSRTDSILLGFTGTHCWVRRENIDDLVAAIEEFWAEHRRFTTLMGEVVDAEPTLPRVAEVLRRAALDESLRGVCFNQTSIVADPWRAQFEPAKPFHFDNDRFTVSGIAPWELFEELDEVSQRESSKEA